MEHLLMKPISPRALPRKNCFLRDLTQNHTNIFNSKCFFFHTFYKKKKLLLRSFVTHKITTIVTKFIYIWKFSSSLTNIQSHNYRFWWKHFCVGIIKKIIRFVIVNFQMKRDKTFFCFINFSWNFRTIRVHFVNPH